MIRFLIGIAALTISAAALAQESYTVEGVAKVRENETARFYSNSVRETGGLRLFEVVIRYADPDDAPPGGTASRKITYRANCDSQEMSISVIALRNARGQTTKAIAVPPGAEEFFKPERASLEDDWLYRVCG
ncbi:MAG TPA: hypothetical protein VMW70_05050 [Burkholderiales bacterium]|jgi:hypothetical protein|nr:hypothetical protein [Burkholderiales bacterium]